MASPSVSQLTQLAIRDCEDNLIHKKISEFDIILGASLLQGTENLDLGILLVDSPISDEPHPGTHLSF